MIDVSSFHGTSIIQTVLVDVEFQADPLVQVGKQKISS